MKRFLNFWILIISVVTVLSSKIYIPEDIKKSVPEDQQHLVFMNAIIDMIQKVYIQKFSIEEITEKILYGLFNELDVHTAYLDEETLEFLKEEIKGRFGGLGLYIMPYEGFIKVMSCLDNGPSIGHLLPGDIITYINDQFIFGIGVEKITRMLKGKPGTEVKLKVKRKNVDPFDIKITRKIVDIPYIFTAIHDHIAYIKVSLFYENVVSDVRKFLRKLKNIKGIKGIIIDLRLNPGGVLEEAVAVSELFLPIETEVLTVKSRLKSEVIKTKNPPFVNMDMPVVVLINAFSASASEIFAGALQQHKRAVIIGEVSYGKGSVQQLIEISKQTAIKMTVAKYYLPNNVDIQAIGVKPDIEVKTKYSDIINFREKDIYRTLKPDSYQNKDVISFSKAEEETKIYELNSKMNENLKNKIQKDVLNADEFILYKKMSISEKLKQDEQLAKAFNVLKDNKKVSEVHSNAPIK